MLLLLLGVTATMWFYLDIVRRLPGTTILGKFPPVVVAFLGGAAFYDFLNAVRPALDVGPTLGNLNLIFVSPLFDHGGRTWHDIASIAWEVVPISAILAIVATLDSLLTFRTAQNAGDLSLSPVRDPAWARIAPAAAPASCPSSRRCSLLAFGLLFPNLLAKIPTVVLAGILLAVGLALFDRSAFQIVSEIP